MYGAMQREDLWLLPARVDPFSAGSPELFSCYQGSQISPRPQILILFFNQSPARTSYKDAASSGWPGSAWSLARQELLPGGEGSAAGWRIAR